jgi:hypothetical protein
MRSMLAFVRFKSLIDFSGTAIFAIFAQDGLDGLFIHDSFIVVAYKDIWKVCIFYQIIKRVCGFVFFCNMRFLYTL